MKRRTSVFCFVITLTILSFCSTTRATPYASSLTNDAGTIWFRLNESAENVKVVSGGVTNDLGALSAGLHSVALGISGTYQIEVSKASPVGYATSIAPNRSAVQQISTDANPLRFLQPR